MDIKTTSLTAQSAYHGGSWTDRTESHSKEMAQKKYWPLGGCRSEYETLKHVLLYSPPQNPTPISDPEKSQHLRALDWKKLKTEADHLRDVFQKQNIQVHTLSADTFKNAPPNLMFCRDHFFMTPWGAVLGRMASPVRAGEEKWAQLALAQAGVPIAQMIRGTGVFEGADALWFDQNTVAIGIGNRTNMEGAQQLTHFLNTEGVDTVLVPLPKSVQHLLGLLQIVDRQTALVRASLIDDTLSSVLKTKFTQIIVVPETREVTELQGMNVVCVGPRQVIMAANCPSLRALYESHNIHVMAEVDISQYLCAAGGIACATGILER